MDGVKDALLGLRAKSKTGRLRELLPIIEAKVEEGVRHEDIHTVLNQLGLSMSLEVYKTTLYRIRKERAETCKTIVSQVLPGSTRGTQPYRLPSMRLQHYQSSRRHPSAALHPRRSIGNQNAEKSRVVIIHLQRRRAS